VGVLLISAVSCRARCRRDTAGSDDVKGTRWERKSGLVGGHTRTEQDAASEPGSRGIGFDDGTRIGHGVCGAYSAGSDGAHGMRGDGMGVGDVGVVSCWARCSRDTAGGDDGRGTGRERDAGLVG
jgi:hypothetical protein